MLIDINTSIVFFLLATLSVSGIFGQSAPTQISARAAGMAYTTSILFDEWGLQGNVAGIAKVEKPKLAFSYDLRPALGGLL